MFESIFREYVLDINKANAMYESAENVFKIQILEASHLANNDFIEEDVSDYELYEETTENFLQKVKNFFNSLREAFSKLVINIQNKIDTEIKKRQLNKKLKEVKKALASNRIAQQKAKQKKVKIFDNVKYMKAYTKYVNIWVAETKKLYSKSYSSADEYLQAFHSYSAKLDEASNKLKLNDDEYFTLETDGLKLLQMTDKELNNYHKATSLIKVEHDNAIKTAENIATKIDDPSKISDIKISTNKLSTKSSTVAKKSSHGMLKLFSAIVAVGAVINFGFGYANGHENGEVRGYNDNVIQGMRAKQMEVYKAGYQKGFNNAY